MLSGWEGCGGDGLNMQDALQAALASPAFHTLAGVREGVQHAPLP